MLVKVNGVPVGEVVPKYPTIIHEWWGELEWRDYELPSQQIYNNCTTQDFQQLVCEADYGVSWIADKLGLDGAYKFINHYVDVIQQGFDSEWQNILALIGG
jgi:hypothetical protein